MKRSMKENPRMVKEAIPVLDIGTGTIGEYAGWREGNGSYIYRHGETYPIEVAYVNLGPNSACHLQAAYIPVDQLHQDTGLFDFAQRFGQR